MANTVNIEDLIRYENENSHLDFKVKQYAKEQRQELIKDVLAMANAFADEQKYLILGIKHYPNGNRDLIGIPERDFVDAANYQQVLIENIEPELEIDYFPFPLDGKIFGVLSILCKNKPYLLKKDFEKLSKGTCLIRKGSTTRPISRNDLDRIYNEKVSANKKEFKPKIKIGFAYNGFKKTLELKEKKKLDLNLTSQRKKEEIQKILGEKIKAKAEREASRKASGDQAMLKHTGLMLPDPEDRDELWLLNGPPYEKRSISTLKQNLQYVEKTYEDEDFYELAETHSFKLNIEILNDGSEYLEDAYIQLRIDNKGKAVFVLPKVARVPDKNSITSAIHYIQLRNVPDVNEGYPLVRYIDTNEIILVEQSIGEIKHKIETVAFKKDIRIFPLFKTNESMDLELRCKVGGRNLLSPVEETLVLRLIPATPF